MAVAPAGLKQCQQAQEQLDSAISCVLRAEQQLRENAREVSPRRGGACGFKPQVEVMCASLGALGGADRTLTHLCGPDPQLCGLKPLLLCGRTTAL